MGRIVSMTVVVVCDESWVFQQDVDDNGNGCCSDNGSPGSWVGGTVVGFVGGPPGSYPGRPG